MAILTDLNEQRKYDRYQVVSGGFVVLLPQILFSKLGSLKDISPGGFAFQYYLEKDIPLKEFKCVDIYISGDGVCLKGLPAKIISDIEISQNDLYFKSRIKRFGLQFGSRTPKEMNKLNQFIEKYTIGKLHPVSLP